MWPSWLTLPLEEVFAVPLSNFSLIISCFPIEQTEEATARQWQGGQEVQGIQVLGDLYAFTLSLYIICYKIKPSIGEKHIFLS